MENKRLHGIISEIHSSVFNQLCGHFIRYYTLYFHKLTNFKPNRNPIEQNEIEENPNLKLNYLNINFTQYDKRRSKFNRKSNQILRMKKFSRLQLQRVKKSKNSFHFMRLKNIIIF